MTQINSSNLTPKQVDLLLECIGNLYQTKRSNEQMQQVIDPEDQSCFYEIYKIPCEDGDLFLKLDLELDSYEENEMVTGISLVSPVEKTVIDYE